MSLGTVLDHLLPLARALRNDKVSEDGGDPSLLFNTIVEAGYLVAAADGTVDAHELTTLKRAVLVLTEDDVSVSELDELVADFVDLRKTLGEDDRCRVVGRVLQSHHAAEEGLSLAAAIAYASNGLDANELKVLEKIAVHAGQSIASVAAIASQVRDELSRRSIPG
ncbi:MAG: tellurite resistance TerB family protein [Deltaproteobacteria bacterium]|nr:tellurite resistance TerB family protein [Deltaproteobacteria bacterium]